MDYLLEGILLFLTGNIAGFVAGLLGIGGAIVLVPMLMYVPPLFGTVFSFYTITGLSMAQVFFAALSGAITHFRGGNLRRRLVIYIGGSMAVGSLIGSITSRFIPEHVLVGVFAFMLALSTLMLVTKMGKKHAFVSLEDCENEKNNVNYTVKPREIYMQTNKEKGIGIVLGITVGMLAGMVGVGGAIILIPILAYTLNVPIKMCIGTSLGIILAGGAAGFLGKAITGQVPFLPTLFLVSGTIIGARFGSKISMKLPDRLLMNALIILLIVTLIRIIISIVA